MEGHDEIFPALRAGHVPPLPLSNLFRRNWLRGKESPSVPHLCSFPPIFSHFQLSAPSVSPSIPPFAIARLPISLLFPLLPYLFLSVSPDSLSHRYGVWLGSAPSCLSVNKQIDAMQT